MHGVDFLQEVPRAASQVSVGHGLDEDLMSLLAACSTSCVRAIA